MYKKRRYTSRGKKLWQALNIRCHVTESRNPTLQAPEALQYLDSLSERDRELLFAFDAYMTWKDSRIARMRTKRHSQLAKVLGFTED